MRLKSCHFKNIGPFVDWKFDLAQFRDDQKLIALVGKNGRGKSSTCELSILGAAYLNTPTQGTLIRRATAADSMLESVIVHGGHEWTLRHMIDAVQATSHSIVLKDGVAIGKKAGARQFKEWADEWLPPRSVVEASLFRYQKSEGFVEMESGPRIAVLLRVIGVERLERKAEIARAKAKEQQEKLDELLRRIEDVRGGDPGVEAAQAALNAANELAAGADAALADARAKLAADQEGAATHAVRKTSREAAEKLIATLQEQAKGAGERRADAERRIEGNRQIQADAVLIREAAAGLEAANAELTRLELALVEADKQIAGLLDPWRDGAARLKAAEQRRAAALARLKDEEAIRDAVVNKPAAVEVAETKRAAVTALEKELEDLQAKGWAGDKEARAALRAGLIEVAELPTYSEGEPQKLARHHVAIDDAAALAAVEVPKQIAALKARLAKDRDFLGMADQKVTYLDKLAARLPDVEAAKADRDAAESEGSEIRSGHAVAVLSGVLRAIGRSQTAAAAAIQAAKLEPMRKIAGRLPALDDSDRRIVQLQEQLTAALAEEAKIKAQIDGVDLVEVGEVPDVAAARRAVADSETAASTARADVAKAEQALARSREVAAKLDGLLGERADVESELADWTRLALDHGRGGMQSDEVDAAGPELTGYINSALRACVGTRWTMTVETQRLDAKGKNLIDKCTIMVLDNEKGTHKEVKEHSGGERTSLAEAIASGLTMLGCKRAGFDRPTLVRDESTNFLDAEAAPLWIKMMRHVVEFTNADRLLFVSHNQDVVRLADATIEPPDQRAVRPQENHQAA